MVVHKLKLVPGGDSQPQVRSLTRGLDILRLLNLEGELSTARIAAATGLARITAYRLLRTLERGGYVVRDASKCYRLGPSILELNSHYAQQAGAIELAAPFMRLLCQRLGWPVVLATNNGPRMVIQHTTRDETGFSVRLQGPGGQLPLLQSASGLVFLAHTEPPLRAELVRAALKLDGKRTLDFQRNPELIAKRLADVAERGFASVRRSWQSASISLSTLAVPIHKDGQVFAALAATYYQSAMSNREAVRRFETPLKHAVEDIAEGLSQMAAH
jgi:IclR family mhp operon transcriptional activator